MTDTSLSINAADFDEVKASLNQFLSNKPAFADYDFAGSNISVLTDLLAFNTYMNLFYKNMGNNETFLDSAVLRDSIVSRAKELNYTPRSFKSAQAVVNIAVTSNNVSRASVVIPKGTLFTSRIDDKSFSFTTDRNIVTTASTVAANNASVTFTATDVNIFEGQYLSETYPYGLDSFVTIDNPQIDTSSLTVSVIEDNGVNVYPYSLATSLLDIDDSSLVYFLQGTTDGKYQIQFGNGVFGRMPKNNALVAVEYRISSGELPNGARSFIAGQTIDSETKIVIDTVTPAHSGAVFESAESIRFAAPRHYQTQERAVVNSDYGRLLRNTFPEIADVTTFGGETTTPKQMGKIIVSVVLNGIDKLPDSKKREYYNFLRSRNTTAIEPVFADPLYLYLDVDSRVYYDVSKTTLNTDDIRTIVIDTVSQYGTTNLNKFNNKLYYSRLTSAIDNSHSSIISNDTSIRLFRRTNANDWLRGSLNINYGGRIASLTSDIFKYNNSSVIIIDDNQVLYLANPLTRNKIISCGKINYESGIVTISSIRPDNVTLPVNIYSTMVDKNISVDSNTILGITQSNIKVIVVAS